MTWKRTVCCVAVLLGTSSLVFADPPSQPENFSVTGKTKVPGLTLKPGSYSIRVVDRLSDRVIVRVDAADGGAHTTFIGLQNPSIPKPATPGLVPWSGSGENHSYVRGWYFPNTSSVVEFVYPKAEAVKIAQKTDTKVPAIDPASEGRVADKNLSHDDMELVTLWLLSSTRVGPSGGTAAIQAERYQQPAGVPSQTAVASSQGSRVEPQSTGATSSDARVQPAATRPQAPVTKVQPQVASVHPPKLVAKTLPHTASELPIVGLLGGLSLMGGFAMRRFSKRAA